MQPPTTETLPTGSFFIKKAVRSTCNCWLRKRGLHQQTPTTENTVEVNFIIGRNQWSIIKSRWQGLNSLPAGLPDLTDWPIITSNRLSHWKKFEILLDRFSEKQFPTEVSSAELRTTRFERNAKMRKTQSLLVSKFDFSLKDWNSYSLKIGTEN